jgi:hypothetical protein
VIDIQENFIQKFRKNNIDYLFDQKMLPFYLYSDSVEGDGKSFMCHTLLARPEDRKDEDDTGIRSRFFEEFRGLLADYYLYVENEKNVKVDLLRAAVNLTFPNGHTEGVWHKDHDYPHKHLIVYLNDPQDKDAVTEIKNGNEIVKVVPQKWKAVIMDDYEHRAIYPKVGERIVLVVTYELSDAS